MATTSASLHSNIVSRHTYVLPNSYTYNRKGNGPQIILMSEMNIPPIVGTHTQRTSGVYCRMISQISPCSISPLKKPPLCELAGSSPPLQTNCILSAHPATPLSFRFTRGKCLFSFTFLVHLYPTRLTPSHLRSASTLYLRTAHIKIAETYALKIPRHVDNSLCVHDVPVNLVDIHHAAMGECHCNPRIHSARLQHLAPRRRAHAVRRTTRDGRLEAD